MYFFLQLPIEIVVIEGRRGRRYQVKSRTPTILHDFGIDNTINSGKLVVEGEIVYASFDSTVSILCPNF